MKKDEPKELKQSPKITIDKLAIRFEFTDGSGINLFWGNLFVDINGDFNRELLRCVHKAYVECIENDILPDTEND